MKSILYLCLLLGIMGCNIQIELQEPTDLFVIPKGKHSSNHPFLEFGGTTLSFDAKFHTNAAYQTVEPENQADINKLMGFSDCNSYHHENSARIGWRWYNDQLEIFAYVLYNEVRIYEFIAAVPMNVYNRYKIQRNQKGYLFQVNDVQKQISTSSYCSSTANYMLWPYFGGDETAPHDITINIDVIEVGTRGSR